MDDAAFAIAGIIGGMMIFVAGFLMPPAKEAPDADQPYQRVKRAVAALFGLEG